jgi:alginate export protein
MKPHSSTVVPTVLAATAVMLLTTATSTLAQTEPALGTALTSGSTNLSFRLRSEHVDDAGFIGDAAANTLRTRLSWRSGNWENMNLLLEMDSVTYLGDDRFNNTRNSNTRYPVVADPDGVDLNQAALQYRLDGGSVTVGRQRLQRGNQRFVGSVGWRQNEQTFDAIALNLTPTSTLELDYAWVNDTRRIFGPENGNPPAALDSDHHLLNARWRVSAELNLDFYSYSLAFSEAPALSSATHGLAVTGERELGTDTQVDYRIEYARQSDYRNNPNDYSADYVMVSAGIKISGVRAALSHEILGADSSAGMAVQTPLATLHAFQGWADKFLNTPAFGVRDTAVSLAGNIAGSNLTLARHDYQADAGSLSLGQEVNIQVAKTFASRYTLAAKFASYQADRYSTDAQKFWLSAEARF